MPISPVRQAEYGAHYAPRGYRPTTDHIVVHCTAGYGGPDALADYFATPQREGGPRGGPWRGPGYNDVITRDGQLVSMLHPRGIGAHIGDIGSGWNSRCSGISWIGGATGNDITDAQLSRLGHRIAELLQRWPTAAVVGHKTLIRRYGAPAKACPWLDVPRWWAADSYIYMGHPSEVVGTGGLQVGDDGPDEPGQMSDTLPTIAFGMRGEDVATAQRRLNAWAGTGTPLVVDAIFGKRTRRAVRWCQLAHGLATDGIVGPLTWGALLRA